MSDWITYDEALERFGLEPVDLRRLVTEGRVLTQRENRIQLFDAVSVQAVVGPPVSTPYIEEVDSGDVEAALAIDTAAALGGEVWVTYQQLMDNYNVKRGWLDNLVHAGRVQFKVEGSVNYYLWSDVEPRLADETAEILGKRR